MFLNLFKLLIKRSLTLRTQGTVLGAAWLFLQPAMQMLAFWFLLAFIFKRSADGLEYFLIGILPWLMLSDTLSRSTSVLLDFASFYQKTAFPIILLPPLPTILSLIIYLPVYFVMCLLLNGVVFALSASVMLLLIMLLLLPLCYLVALISVFVRDVIQALPVILTFIMYITPVLYSPDALPSIMQDWLFINPFSDIMVLIHWHFMTIDIPWPAFLRLSTFTIIFAWLAYKLHIKSLPHLREFL